MAVLSKEQLYQKVAEAIRSCGWTIGSESETSQQPVRIEITKGNTSNILRIYIWNLTHGGKSRPENEYRIQVTIDRFEEESNSRTLILGYWDEKQVFAGFDVSKHIGKPGWSASMQIKKEYLEEALQNKVAAYSKENGEIAIAFIAPFFMQYVEDSFELHSTGNTNKYFASTAPDENIEDEAENEVLSFRYSISSFGADYPVDAIVKRIDSQVIFVPPFQRNFVWNIKEASRFIESLILGLPVPGVFFSKEEETNRMLIVDGQQRIFSLYSFYKNNFKGKPFKLTGVQNGLDGKFYSDLTSSDRIRLDDSIIHATIVKQDQPDDNESSIYLIFERLNSGGRPLAPQEIRACIYYGEFNEYLNTIILQKEWRNIFGRLNERLKEQELLLRFFALYFDLDNYQKPLKGFLNTFMQSNRKLNRFSAAELDNLVYPVIELVNSTLGKKAFRLGSGVNAAIFDSIMIGLCRRLQKGPVTNPMSFVETYNNLIADGTFTIMAKDGTSDDVTVKNRIRVASSKLDSVE